MGGDAGATSLEGSLASPTTTEMCKPLNSPLPHLETHAKGITRQTRGVCSALSPTEPFVTESWKQQLKHPGDCFELRVER